MPATFIRRFQKASGHDVLLDGYLCENAARLVAGVITVDLVYDSRMCQYFRLTILLLRKHSHNVLHFLPSLIIISLFLLVPTLIHL